MACISAPGQDVGRKAESLTEKAKYLDGEYRKSAQITNSTNGRVWGWRSIPSRRWPRRHGTGWNIAICGRCCSRKATPTGRSRMQTRRDRLRQHRPTGKESSATEGAVTCPKRENRHSFDCQSCVRDKTKMASLSRGYCSPWVASASDGV